MCQVVGLLGRCDNKTTHSHSHYLRAMNLNQIILLVSLLKNNNKDSAMGNLEVLFVYKVKIAMSYSPSLNE